MYLVDEKHMVEVCVVQSFNSLKFVNVFIKWIVTP